jgi:hypothetical protein
MLLLEAMPLPILDLCAEPAKRDAHREEFCGQDESGCGACGRIRARSDVDPRDARVGVLATIARGICR